MPKIPGASALKTVIPTTSGQIDTRGVGANIGQGVADIGSAIETVRERKVRNQMAKANADMSIALISESNAYDEDPDYKTFDKRFSENTEKKLGDVAASIEDGEMRNEFINNFRPKIAVNREKVRGLATGKEGEFERGELTTRLETLRNSAVLSGDITEANEQALNLIQSHADLGHVDADYAVKLRNAFRDDLSKGYIEAQAPENRGEALKQPWAKKHLAPEVYAKLKRKADEDLRIEKAQTQVDEYLSNPDVDRADVMADIDKKYSKKPELRAAIEKRFDYAFAAGKKAVIEEQTGLFDKHFLPIRSGESTVAQIPREELEKMTPSQQNSLFAAQQSSVSATKVPFNVGAEDQLNYLRKTRQFQELRKFYTENAGGMSDSQNKSWSEVSIEGVVPVEIESLFTAKASIDTKTPNYSKENRAELKEAVDDWYQKYQKIENRIPPDDVIDKKVDSLIMEYGTTGWFMGRDIKPVYKMSPDEETFMFQQAREQDQSAFDDTRAYFEAKEIKPDAAQIMEIYEILRKKRSGAK